MKPDEVLLWQSVKEGTPPRVAGRELGIAPARVVYLCEKWARRGVYDYGVSADLGWATVTPKDGIEQVRGLVEKWRQELTVEQRRERANKSRGCAGEVLFPEMTPAAAVARAEAAEAVIERVRAIAGGEYRHVAQEILDLLPEVTP